MAVPVTTVFTFGGMNNVSDPTNVGIPDTSVRVQDRAYTQCVDMPNCDVDNNLNAICRAGISLVVGANVTSAWSDGATCYCVVNGQINSFDGTTLTPLANSPTLQPVVEFCPVNNIVVFSDNSVIGMIDAGVIAMISAPSESVDLLDLESWVKANYPAGADAPESNIEVNAFNVTTMAGRCLEFFNGALYLAVDNFVYCTKVFNVERMDIRYNTVAGFPKPVTMLKAVTDGLFVGTGDTTYFLAGSKVYVPDENLVSVTRGFTQRRILPFGAIYGSALKAPAMKIGPLKDLDTAILWLTPDGVYAGGNGGKYVDLTSACMYMPETSSAAAALHRQGEAWQYVASTPGGTAVVVNLANASHSYYLGYAYASLFKLAGAEYGANASGICSFSGDAPVDASFTTPTVDFGVPQLKRCADAYLHARTSGDLSLTVYVDELEQATELPAVAKFNLENGVRRFRFKLPRGCKGTNWQFKISNVDGAPFTALSFKVIPILSDRSI